MAGLAPDRVFVALDFADLEEAEGVARVLRPAGVRFKVGLELFCRFGPEGVRRLQQEAGPVLLDLKLHDIPHTVERAAAALGDLEIWGVTLHAAGGPEMLRAAVGAASAAPRPFRCLGVTVLTSLDAATLQTMGARLPLAEQVVVLAQVAADAGCAGVVASPHEVGLVRAATSPAFLIVTPGVRPQGSAPGDQARAATPADVARAGADFLVVGRPVTQAPDRGAALARILWELRGEGSAGA